jgi:hypothetical protein
MKIRHTTPLLLLFAAPILSATITPTFVSAFGDDSHTCSRLAPCQTWDAALAKTTPGGVVAALDATMFYGTANITQPVTIDGNGVALMGAVNVTATGTVIVRNLTVLGQGGGIAISNFNGADLRIENVTVSGFISNGLICKNGGTCSLDRVRIQNASYFGNGAGVLAWGSKVYISNSQMSLCEVGVATLAGGVMQVTNSIIQNNTIGVSTNDNGNPLVAAAGAGGTIRLNGNTITDNTTGLQVAGSGAAIVSFGNNAIFGNNVNGNPTLATTNR